MKTLLPIDGSPAALAAVRHALRCAQAGLASSYVLVNVQDPATLYEVVVAHDSEALTALRREAGCELLAPAEALLEAADADYESEVAGGQPATLLVELLENYGCDVVVMGAVGMGRMGVPDDAGLGSVALALLHHSPVPVTVVRVAAEEALADAEPQGAPA
jgi:nucleotide-binding universal stress UspA family protein